MGDLSVTYVAAPVSADRRAAAPGSCRAAAIRALVQVTGVSAAELSAVHAGGGNAEDVLVGKLVPKFGVWALLHVDGQNAAGVDLADEATYTRAHNHTVNATSMLIDGCPEALNKWRFGALAALLQLHDGAVRGGCDELLTYANEVKQFREAVKNAMKDLMAPERALLARAAPPGAGRRVPALLAQRVCPS
jgi:hypothetical protein